MDGGGLDWRRELVYRFHLICESRYYRRPLSLTNMIRNAGVDPARIEYLKTPPDRGTLESLIGRMGIRTRDPLRQKGTPYAELGNGKSVDDAVGDGEPAINRSWQPARGGCGDAQQEALLACPMIDELNASKSQSGPIFID